MIVTHYAQIERIVTTLVSDFTKIVYREETLLMRGIRQMENMYNRLKSFDLILFFALIEFLNLDNTFPMYFCTFLKYNTS